MARERFNDINTDGYTVEQLREANRRYEERVAKLSDEEMPDKSIRDWIAEQVLTEIDAELDAA